MMDYNLAENIIQDEEIRNLDFQSVLSDVKKSYQRADVIEDLFKFRRKRTFGATWNSFEKKLADSIINKSKCVESHPLIRSVVNISGCDIFSLYWKVPNDEEFRLFLKYLVLNWQDGSVNLYKTVLKILDESDLLNELKFELACKYFVGEERVKKYGKLLTKSMRSSMCCSDPSCVRCIPLKFWQDNLEEVELDSSLSNGSVNVPPKKFRAEEKQKHNFPFYFKWALYSANDIAVQYLWENLSPTTEDKRKCSLFTLPAFLNFGTTNITAYLISKTQGDNTLWKVEKIRDGDEIMGNFLRNGRWQKYVINIIKASREKMPISFFSQCSGLVSILNYSAFKSLETNLFRKNLEEFLKMIPTDVMVIELFLECKANVLYPILKSMDYEALQILLKIYNETDVSSLLDNDEALRLYHWKIGSCAFLEIEKFLKKVFNSEIMFKFLSRVVDDCYFYFCELFILHKKMDGLRLFSNWCEKFVPVLVKNKKFRLSSKSNGNILRQILFSSDNKYENPFEYSGEFLLWSLGNKEAVDEFKRCIISKPNLKEGKKAYYGLYFYDDFRRCVERSQYDLLDEFFIWSGCDKETIRLLKSQMSTDNRISKHFCSTKDNTGFWRFLKWVDKESEK